MIKLHHFPIVQKVWSFYESDLLVFTVKQNSFNLNSPTIPLLLLLLMSSMISVLYFKRWDKRLFLFYFNQHFTEKIIRSGKIRTQIIGVVGRRACWPLDHFCHHNGPFVYFDFWPHRLFLVCFSSLLILLGTFENRFINLCRSASSVSRSYCKT